MGACCSDAERVCDLSQVVLSQNEDELVYRDKRGKVCRVCFKPLGFHLANPKQKKGAAWEADAEAVLKRAPQECGLTLEELLAHSDFYGPRSINGLTYKVCTSCGGFVGLHRRAVAVPSAPRATEGSTA